MTYDTVPEMNKNVSLAKGINNNNTALQSPAIWQHTQQSAQPLEMQLFSQDLMSKLN